MSDFSKVDFDTPEDLVFSCWDGFAQLGCEVRIWKQETPPNLPALSECEGTIAYGALRTSGLNLDERFCVCGALLHSDPELSAIVCFFRLTADRSVCCRILFSLPLASGRFIQYQMIASGLRRPRVGAKPGGLPREFQSIFLLLREQAALDLNDLFAKDPGFVVKDESSTGVARAGAANLAIRRCRLTYQGVMAMAICGSSLRIDGGQGLSWIALERCVSMCSTTEQSQSLVTVIGRKLLDLGAFQLNLDEFIGRAGKANGGGRKAPG